MRVTRRSGGVVLKPSMVMETWDLQMDGVTRVRIRYVFFFHSYSSFSVLLCLSL